jgi:quercetin dioxygenase-like cupin family protein
MRALFVVMLGVLLALVSVTWATNHAIVEPKDLKWEDASALPPGAKVAVIEGPMDQATPFIIRFKFPADYKIPAHWHPAIEHVTVLSGTMNLGVGDKLDPMKSHTIPAGGVAIMPAKTNHFGWTKEETVVQVHGMGPWGLTYVDPADDPRKK